MNKRKPKDRQICSLKMYWEAKRMPTASSFIRDSNSSLDSCADTYEYAKSYLYGTVAEWQIKSKVRCSRSREKLQRHRSTNLKQTNGMEDTDDQPFLAPQPYPSLAPPHPTQLTTKCITWSNTLTSDRSTNKSTDFI